MFLSFLFLENNWVIVLSFFRRYMAPLQGVVSMEGGSVTPGHIQVNGSGPDWCFLVMVEILFTIFLVYIDAVDVLSAPAKTLRYALPHCSEYTLSSAIHEDEPLLAPAR